MKKSITEVVEHLRREYASDLAFAPGQKQRKFSLEFKQRLLSEASSNGHSDKLVADGLGISLTAVYGWRRQLELSPPKKPREKCERFKKIAIEQEFQVSNDLSPYLVTASGVRVVGLSVSQMTELLRGL